MAYPKKVNASNKANQQRAIDAHAGFVSFVVGKVKKVGIEKVLKSSKDASEDSENYYWLKKSYEKVLAFAEEVQIKAMPTKVSGEDEDGNAIPLVLYLPEVKGEA